MSQFSIHIHGNNSPTSIEFVEKQYKLGAGETLVGKADDFPEKKSLAGLFDIEPYFNGWKVATGTETLIENTLQQSGYSIPLYSIIDTVFPPISEETYPDRYITGELELFYASCHRCDTSDDPPVRRTWAVTANKLFRFSVLKNYSDDLNGMNYSFNGSLTPVSQTGRYTIFDAAAKVFDQVLSVGELNPAAYPVSMGHGIDPALLGITLSAALADHTNFSRDGKYRTEVLWKLRLFNHDILDFTVD